MLRVDVVKDCEQGLLHVYAVETVCETLEIFTGVPTGYPEEGNIFTAGCNILPGTATH